MLKPVSGQGDEIATFGRQSHASQTYAASHLYSVDQDRPISHKCTCCFQKQKHQNNIEMASCVLNSCCGCIDLKTGSLIIGYLNLIGEITFIIISILGLVGGGVVAAGAESLKQALNVQAVMIVSVILLLIVFFFFAFTVVLLVGIHQNKRGYVMAYLIVGVVCLVLSLITTLASFATAANGTVIACHIVSYIISVYFLLVIRSYYLEMEDRNKPAIYNTA
ncbi:hypothetical protein NE865_13108 [Phthorimaea operculella]|nr:hypothetical protein NE865_13108 [Phthorimaea operculella]